MATTTNMSLTTWAATDTFNWQQLKDNFDKIDAHNHESNQGVKINTNGIEDNAITSTKIAPQTIQAADIAPGAIGPDQLATNAVTPVKIDFASVNQISTSLSGTGYEDGDVIYYKPNDNADYVWQLRFTTTNAVNRWYFIGGAPLLSINNSFVNMTDTTNSPSPSSGQNLSLSASSIPQGKYFIRYDGLLDFAYVGGQTDAEFRVKIFNGATEIGNTVIKPPTQGVSNTQLATSVTLPILTTFTSTASLMTEGYTIYRQTSAPPYSVVSRQSLSITPIYLTVL